MKQAHHGSWVSIREKRYVAEKDENSVVGLNGDRHRSKYEGRRRVLEVPSTVGFSFDKTVGSV